MNEALLKFARILAEAAQKRDFQLVHPTIEPVDFFFGIRSYALRGNKLLVGHRGELRDLTETLGQAFFFLANERIAEGDLGIEVLQADFSRGRAQLEQRPAAIQYTHSAPRAPVAACRRAEGQTECRIRFDAACPTRFDHSFDVGGEIAWQEDDDIAISGTE